MGGRVQARTSELGGLAIDVDLPIAAAPLASAAIAGMTEPGADGPTILLVEDDERDPRGARPRTSGCTAIGSSRPRTPPAPSGVGKRAGRT